jgi:hypothetical protein
MMATRETAGASVDRVEINGEYVLRVEPVAAGARVSVAKARCREFLLSANALIEEQARARGGLQAIEPIIDNVRFVVTAGVLAGLMEALRAVRFGARDYASLTEEGARRAVLARIAAVGGSVAWEDACPPDLVAAAFPLGYRGRDAISALVASGALVAIRERGQPPRLQLTPAGQQRIT